MTNPIVRKCRGLREFLGEFGFQLKGGELPDAKHYAELLEQVKGHIDYHLIQTVMLRSLKQARYQPENFGHFGLALDAYAHFTSPIRRYPDLLVHRAIRHVLTTRSAKKFAYNNEDMVLMGEHCSMTDRRADEVTRDVVNWLKCEFMRDKVGDEFNGVISSVTSFGLFIELNEIFVEGLVHVSELDNDYYHFEAKGHRLVGERTAHIFRLGDPVRIKVVRVDLDERKIDFTLLEHESAKTEYKPETSSSKGKKKTGRKKSGSRKSASSAKNKDRKQTSEKVSTGKKTTKKKTTNRNQASGEARKKKKVAKAGTKASPNSRKKTAVKNKAAVPKKKAAGVKKSKVAAKASPKKKSLVKRMTGAIKKMTTKKKK